MSSAISYGFLAPCQNLEKKLMIQLQENARPDGRTEGMMERRTDLIFLGPFQLPPVGPKTSNGFQLLIVF